MPKSERSPHRASVAAIAFLIAFALCLALCSGPSVEPSLPRAIVLITLDTLRADHLSSYGYERETTPRIDAFAAGGARFARAVSPMPTTDPAHASMLTGLYPRTHGIVENGVRIADPGLPNLASWARERGYRSAAFVSRKHLVPSELSLRGFDEESGPEGKERRGDLTLMLAESWLERNATRPFFLWLHFFDPHYPYEAPEPYGRRFTPEMHPPPVVRDNKERTRAPYSDTEMSLLEDLYDGEIAFTDALVGGFLDRLHELLPEEAGAPLIVLAADHGELMGEIEDRHLFCFDHGKWLYQGALEVPLVVHWAGRVEGGAVVDELVELVDLPQTIFDLLGTAGFPSQGESLAPLLVDPSGGHDEGPRYAFTERRRLEPSAEAAYDSWQRLAVQDERFKLVRDAAGRSQLFDLLDDPEERVDLAGDLPERYQVLEQALDDWLARTPSLEELDDAEISPEKIEALRSLGYID